MVPPPPANIPTWELVMTCLTNHTGCPCPACHDTRHPISETKTCSNSKTRNRPWYLREWVELLHRRIWSLQEDNRYHRSNSPGWTLALSDQAAQNPPPYSRAQQRVSENSLAGLELRHPIVPHRDTPDKMLYTGLLTLFTFTTEEFQLIF